MAYVKNKRVYGVGINDANYNVVKYDENRKNVWTCPYYNRWKSLLERVYSEVYHKKRPTYKGTTVCAEWLIFSNFKKWVDEQDVEDWEKLVIDKDLLSTNGKHYSPETCVFISNALNVFLTDSASARGDYLIGVSRDSRLKNDRFRAQCSNPFGKTKAEGKYLGSYHTEEEAHLAWKRKKREYTLQFIKEQTDRRVIEKLEVMFV